MPYSAMRASTGAGGAAAPAAETAPASSFAKWGVGWAQNKWLRRFSRESQQPLILCPNYGLPYIVKELYFLGAFSCQLQHAQGADSD